MMNVNRTMLRFRPIAPKPSAGGVELSESKNMAGRKKRKYVRVRRNRRSKKHNSPGQGQDVDGSGKEIVTLQLLPEKADRVAVDKREGEGEGEERWWCSARPSVDHRPSRLGVGMGPPTWTNRSEGCGATDLTVREDETRVLESWVTVECVTDACINIIPEHVARGGMEVERVKMMLEKDTCPGMISEGQKWRVEWVNEAYRRMVRQGGDRQLRIGLVVREGERLLGVTQSGGGFSCRVRVHYLYTNRTIGDQWSHLVAPCDVWKINGGRFAWRLDIQAALSLGR